MVGKVFYLSEQDEVAAALVRVLAEEEMYVVCQCFCLFIAGMFEEKISYEEFADAEERPYSDWAMTVMRGTL